MIICSSRSWAIFSIFIKLISWSRNWAQARVISASGISLHKSFTKIHFWSLTHQSSFLSNFFLIFSWCRPSSYCWFFSIHIQAFEFRKLNDFCISSWIWIRVGNSHCRRRLSHFLLLPPWSYWPSKAILILAQEEESVKVLCLCFSKNQNLIIKNTYLYKLFVFRNFGGI